MGQSGSLVSDHISLPKDESLALRDTAGEVSNKRNVYPTIVTRKTIPESS
jgi:hypothetical protein